MGTTLLCSLVILSIVSGRTVGAVTVSIGADTDIVSASFGGVNLGSQTGNVASFAWADFTIRDADWEAGGVLAIHARDNKVDNMAYLVLMTNSGPQVVSDTTWKCSSSFVLGWDSGAFDDSGWANPSTSSATILYQGRFDFLDAGAQFMGLGGSDLFCRKAIPAVTPAADQCKPNPCQHGGTCSNGQSGHTCTCANGWKGASCEEQNECEPNPCVNGGTCTPTVSGYSCSCGDRYSGPNCEEVNECEPNPCKNGGTCTPTESGYTCSCTDGYEGTNCAEKNHCEPNPCQNSGKCTNHNDDYTCECPPLYTGKDCKVRNLCYPNPCKHGGECTNYDTHYDCSCSGSWMGENCDEKNNCKPNPCQNDGKCTNHDDDYSCECPPTYTGNDCDLKNLCYPNPCQHGGECTNYDTHYDCSCSGSWMGEDCHEKNHCKPNPCQNEGKCTNHVDDYTCECPPAYTGNDCEQFDRCYAEPCKNGGTCTNNYAAGTYKCECGEAWTGTHCDEERPLHCNSSPCQNGGTCTDIGFSGYSCTCKDGFTGDNCQTAPSPQDTEPAVCLCKGDPHCFAFDADKTQKSNELFITKSCVYTLVRDACGGPTPSFEISANFQRPKDTLERTYVSDLRVTHAGVPNLYLGQGPVLAVGDPSSTVSMPYSSGDLIAVEEIDNMKVSLPNGVVIKWDGIKMVQIEVPKTGQFTDNLCGVCGNNDGVPTNDLAMGPHLVSARTRRDVGACPGQLALGTTGFQAENLDNFVGSWFKEMDPGDPNCENECR